MREGDMDRRYDIVRKENEKAMFWLEGVADLSAAKTRVKQLLSFWPGEYQVFDLTTREMVLSSSALSEIPEEIPASNSAE